MNVRRFAAAVGMRPLWFQLALLAAVIALPLMLSTYVMFDRLVENSRITKRQTLELTAKTLSSLVENEIQTHIAIVRHV